MKHSTEELANTDLSEKIGNPWKDVMLLLTGQWKLEHFLGLIKKLQKDNAEKDVKIITLEKQINKLVQYSCLDNVLVSGLKVNHTSYLRSVVKSNSVQIN